MMTMAIVTVPVVIGIAVGVWIHSLATAHKGLHNLVTSGQCRIDCINAKPQHIADAGKQIAAAL
jgi:hypothetical protein